MTYIISGVVCVSGFVARLKLVSPGKGWIFGFEQVLFNFRSVRVLAPCRKSSASVYFDFDDLLLV